MRSLNVSHKGIDIFTVKAISRNQQILGKIKAILFVHVFDPRFTVSMNSIPSCPRRVQTSNYHSHNHRDGRARPDCVCDACSKSEWPVSVVPQDTRASHMGTRGDNRESKGNRRCIYPNSSYNHSEVQSHLAWQNGDTCPFVQDTCRRIRCQAPNHLITVQIQPASRSRRTLTCMPTVRHQNHWSNDGAARTVSKMLSTLCALFLRTVEYFLLCISSTADSNVLIFFHIYSKMRQYIYFEIQFYFCFINLRTVTFCQ